jgi:nicotinic acid mononucleotide adenylyltransferase
MNLPVDTINKINNSGYKFFITATGGGTSFIGDYLSVPGGSKAILGFYVPYSQQLFDEFIGGKPDKYVSSEAARKLAMASFEKAASLGNFVDRFQCVGVGVTASLSTGPGEREGRKHFVYIAIQTFSETWTIGFEIVGERAAEEKFVSESIFAEMCNLILDREGFEKDRGVRASLIELKNAGAGGGSPVAPLLIEMFNGNLDILNVNGQINKESSLLPVFPGSFNPLHEGHKEILNIAERALGVRPVLEISIKNVDKPPLDFVSIEERIEGSKGEAVLLTTTPKIFDKIKLLQESYPEKKLVFVMGLDTWKRFLDPKYDGTGAEIQAKIDYIKGAGVKFLVFGRGGEGPFYPHHCYPQMIECEEAYNFNMSISSSEIRKFKT